MSEFLYIPLSGEVRSAVHRVDACLPGVALDDVQIADLAGLDSLQHNSRTLYKSGVAA